MTPHVHVWVCIAMDKNDALYKCECGAFSDGHGLVWTVCYGYCDVCTCGRE